MKREDLEKLGLSKEQIDTIMAENGKDIEKYKTEAETAAGTIKTLEETKKTLETTVTDRDKQLEELKKVDPKVLQEEIKKLQGENKTAKEKYETDVKQIKLDAALETRLIKEGAVNSKAVKALLDASKISMDGENLVGLDDQLKSLKETEKWAFSSTPPAGRSGTRQGVPPGSGDDATLADEITGLMYGKTE